MCLIVDVNIANDVFMSDGDTDYEHVRSALRDQQAILMYGGQLAKEYAKSGRIMGIIKEYDRAGIAKRYPDGEVNAETESVRSTGLCVSDDQHIIALARVSNARVLCTHDANLRIDFRNAALVSHPRGSIFSSSAHRHLLIRHCT